MSNTGKKLLRSSTVNLVANIVTLGIGFILMPIIIRDLGDRHYGIWVLTAAFLGFYGLCDLGISEAVSRFLSKSLGNGNEDDFRSYFATCFYILCALGCIVAVLTGVLSIVGGLFIKDAGDAKLFRWLIVILGASLALQFPGRTFRGLLVSHLRYDLNSAVTIVRSILRFPVVLAVLNAGYGIIGLAAASALMEIVSMGAVVVMACNTHKKLSISPKLFSGKKAKEVMQYGSHTLIAQTADMLKFRISPFVIATFTSVTMVTPFAIADRLSKTVGGIMRALLGVLSPVFSRQDGRGDHAAMRSSYLLACKLATYASVLLGGMMFMLGEVFIERWMGAEYLYVTIYMRVLVIGTIFASAQIPSVGFLFGTSRHNFYAKINVIHGILCLAMTSLLIKPFGLLGVSVGLMAPTVIIKFFVQPIYVCRVLKISLKEFYIDQQALNFSIVIIYLAVVRLVAAPFIRASFINIFAIASISCLLFIPYILLTGFKGSQRQIIIKTIVPAKLRAA